MIKVIIINLQFFLRMIFSHRQFSLMILLCVFSFIGCNLTVFSPPKEEVIEYLCPLGTPASGIAGIVGVAGRDTVKCTSCNLDYVLDDETCVSDIGWGERCCGYVSRGCLC